MLMEEVEFSSRFALKSNPVNGMINCLSKFRTLKNRKDPQIPSDLPSSLPALYGDGFRRSITEIRVPKIVGVNLETEASKIFNRGRVIYQVSMLLPIRHTLLTSKIARLVPAEMRAIRGPRKSAGFFFLQSEEIQLRKMVRLCKLKLRQELPNFPAVQNFFETAQSNDLFPYEPFFPD